MTTFGLKSRIACKMVSPSRLCAEALAPGYADITKMPDGKGFREYVTIKPIRNCYSFSGCYGNRGKCRSLPLPTADNLEIQSLNCKIQLSCKPLRALLAPPLQTLQRFLCWFLTVRHHCSCLIFETNLQCLDVFQPTYQL